jgi:hypothetical protein
VSVASARLLTDATITESQPGRNALCQPLRHIRASTAGLLAYLRHRRLSARLVAMERIASNKRERCHPDERPDRFVHAPIVTLRWARKRLRAFMPEKARRSAEPRGKSAGVLRNR